MAKKKVSRKQLLNEPDEFLTFTGGLLKWSLEHKTLIAGVLGGLFALIIIASALKYFSIQSENRAFARLQEAKQTYQSRKEEAGVAEAWNETNAVFQELVEEHGKNRAGMVARVIYADIAFEADHPDLAIELYRRARGDFTERPGITNLILSGLGYAYEKKGDIPLAIRHFEQIVQGTDPVAKGEALFNLGRLYSRSGQEEKSLQAYEKLVSDYPDSIYIELAKDKAAG